MRVWLLEAKTRSCVESTLVPITVQHIEWARTAWTEEFQRRQRECVGDQDVMVWKQGVMSVDLPPNGYVIINGGEVQGVVTFDQRLQPSRRRPGTTLLYVTYLATAPWNRKFRGADGRFRHVGRILVGQSIRESIELGCPGRIGLHSFPSAASFYDKLNFENCGLDPARRGLSYFELRPGHAFELLSDFGRRPDIPIETP